MTARDIYEPQYESQFWMLDRAYAGLQPSSGIQDPKSSTAQKG